MRKLIILWFILLLVVKCSFEKEQERVSLTKDPLLNAYKLDKKVLDKSEIGDDLNYFLKKYNRHWNKQNKDILINVLYEGQKEFNIDYKIVMAIISVESQYNIMAVGKNKTSKDFSLTQQNDRYLKYRYKVAEKHLKEKKIKCNPSNKFDIPCNVYSCFMYLKNITEYSDLIQFSDYINAYNRGVHGVQRNRSNNVYYNKFMQEYMEI